MSQPFGTKPKTAATAAVNSKSVGRVGTAGATVSAILLTISFRKVQVRLPVVMPFWWRNISSKCFIHSLKSVLVREDNKPLLDKYVPTTTLLEPNNNIPSWEAGDEEKKEVSSTLRKLRIKYDNINKLVREKENELEELKVGWIMDNCYILEKTWAEGWGGVQGWGCSLQKD